MKQRAHGNASATVGVYPGPIGHAYARFVGIVPPWTEDMQKKQPEKKEAPAKDKQ